MNITINLMTAIGVILLITSGSVTDSTPLSAMIAIGAVGIAFLLTADQLRRNR